MIRSTGFNACSKTASCVEVSRWILTRLPKLVSGHEKTIRIARALAQPLADERTTKALGAMRPDWLGVADNLVTKAELDDSTR